MRRPINARVRRFNSLAVERLECRLPFSVDVPLGDLAEGNAASWTTFASDNAATSIQNQTVKVREGTSGLRFQTASGFDTGVRLPAPAEKWNLSNVNLFEFWVYGQNTNSFGFQGEQPVVRLTSTTGSRTLTPTTQLMSNGSWVAVHAPLAGSSQWSLQDSGVFDPTNVTGVEIHQDTWDFGFTVYYDGVHFAQRSASSLPPAGPTPPPGVNPNAISPRVLLYVFDPIMENKGGVRMHQAYGWDDPVDLSNQVVSQFNANSHGLLQYNIVDTIIADVHPYYNNGFQYTDEGFDIDWLARDFSKTTSMFNYIRFINENNLVNRIDSGDIDEVWIYSNPMGGTWESTMAGQGAYSINGPVQEIGNRAFPIMGLNYERKVAEALHSFGHRAESVLDHIYGQQGPVIENNWDKFAYQDRYNPGAGLGGIGNIHFPVNGVADYDYENTTAVLSNADDWYNYPNFQGTTRLVSRTDWQRPDGDWQLGYMNWWYDHLPHVAGRGTDGYLNNWWRYLADINQFKAGGANLTFTRGVPQVTTLTPVIGPSTGKVAADAWVDGALARVDLYIDGQYHSSDTVAPFNFQFNTATLPAGSHTLQTKAYEQQNGTEAVSNIRSFSIGNVPPQMSGTTTRVYSSENTYIPVLPDGVVQDPDSADFAAARLVFTILTGVSTDDSLMPWHLGSGPGQIGVVSNQIRYGNVPIATFSGGSGASPLTIVFNASADLSRVQAVLRSIVFQTGDNPGEAVRTIRIRMTDGDGGTSNALYRGIRVLAINDAPVLVTPGPASYQLNGPSVPITPTATAADADNSSFAGGTLKVWLTEGKTVKDQLTFGGPFSQQGNNVVWSGQVIGALNVNGGKNGMAVIISLNANATKAVTQALIRNIRFSTINSTSLAAREVAFILSDSLGKFSVAKRVWIHVRP